ncbi:sugar ABC transporter permease [Deinococcus sp. Arct2-2]|uniref:carbohydrate ABC transporter permease n=1 Tax=Deinococcus sp. Arct2-2 TaxID=2568653 RepID=UPI0010A4984F|nr:sugar ABC transporter permease [Deinococcus sp. Arct2-2]THF70205.1 sugar ABC transporter permease [Deinococcus sp. Arct2-2]
MHTQRRITPFVFLAPAVLVLAVVGIYPLIFAAWVSLHTYLLAQPNIPHDFVWLSNYLTVLKDGSFWGAIGRTLLYLGVSLPIQIALGLGIAMLLRRGPWGRLRGFARVALVIPLAMTPVVTGLIGRLMFNQDFGVVNFALNSVTGQTVGTEWLGNPNLAFVTILLMEIWQWTPFAALIFLSGLTAVPVEVEEAATLETRSFWAMLRHIQLPFLLPALTAILILRTADILKQFDMVYTLTSGGPGSSTELINLYITRIGLRGAFDQGVASAQAILMLVLTTVLSRMYIRYLYRGDNA